MSSTVCRAKNPATCHYHGNRSDSNTRMLRDKMVLARSVYKASKTDAEKFDAYNQLREAEESYYGTEEGRTSLINHINSTPDEATRRHWLDILQRADQKREFLELQNSDNVWVPPKKPLTVELPFHPTPVLNFNHKNERVFELTTGSYPSGETYRFDWNENTGTLYYEELDDIESFRTLGKASTMDEAKQLAERWYNRQLRSH